MMKISAMAGIPALLIAALVLKPKLIGVGVFITTLVIEFLVNFMVSDYHADD